MSREHYRIDKINNAVTIITIIGVAFSVTLLVICKAIILVIVSKVVTIFIIAMSGITASLLMVSQLQHGPVDTAVHAGTVASNDNIYLEIIELSMVTTIIIITIIVSYSSSMEGTLVLIEAMQGPRARSMHKMMETNIGK